MNKAKHDILLYRSVTIVLGFEIDILISNYNNMKCSDINE